jgi:CRISPR-associated protein Cas1
MKTLVIDKKEAILKFDNSAIKIEEQSIPYRFIDLLILNHKIVLETGDILKLTKEGISILIVSYSNDNLSLISSANTKNGEIKLAQYHSSVRHIDFAKYFISRKIVSHNEQLVHNEIDISCIIELQQLENANSIDSIMGIEGSYARKYFKEYFPLLPNSLHKSKRSKQPPLDPVNAILSFWYSLYYNIITVKLLSYGFEPAIGYLHTPFRSHNALSSDLLELFRADINEAVKHLFINEVVTIEDFSKKGGVYLKFDGRKKIWSYFIALTETLKPKLDMEIANLRKMIYDEKNTHS